MFKKYLNKLKQSFFDPGDVFWKNEVKANMTIASIDIWLMINLLLCLFLNAIGVFNINSRVFVPIVIQSEIELAVPAILCHYYKGEKKWLRSFLLFFMAVVFARVESVLTFRVALLICLPTVLSVLYYSRTLTVAISVITTILFAVADFCAIAFQMGVIDLNFIKLSSKAHLFIETDLLTALKRTGLIDYRASTINIMLRSFIPKIIIFVVVAIVCIVIASRGKQMILDQDEEARRTQRISTELDSARDIQAKMLPYIYPAFPEKNNFDIYATMTPAKEVGGDFYDFFMIDDSHLAFLIADVSGKGVPAALFMVITKTLIKDHAQLGLSPDEVFTRVNDILCERNEAGLFVTAWMAIVDLETGEMKYANAGHNPPVLIQNNKANYLRSKPGFVLAGLNGIKYKANSLKLNKGDKLFLYTDGVTEATNSKMELLGEKKLLDTISNFCTSTVVEIVHAVDDAVYMFEGESEQFDDVTMLAFDYSSKDQFKDKEERTFDADVNNLHQVLSFVEENLERHECSMKTSMSIQICVEEIFVNISSYAYEDKKGTATICIQHYDDVVEISFMDTGVPFNPLEKEDPNINASAEDRNVGGLGIFMVKKTMDSVSYEYRYNTNIQTIRKKIK